MHVSPGEIVTIIGSNGAGKTTLLSTIMGLIRGDEGEIFFNNINIMRMDPEKIVEHGCSLVPEGRQIFSTMTVEENLLLGAYPMRKNKKGKPMDDLGKMYDLFPRLKERRSQLGGTMSGGEQQMLAIGRALMAQPKLLILDEPSMGLAPIVVKTIFQVIVKLREQGNTILLVEQNARAALKIADRGYVLETGQILIGESSEDLLNNNDVQRAYLGKEYTSISE
jgi:branched-chain amino acid transport system ATP-binding protein